MRQTNHRLALRQAAPRRTTRRVAALILALALAAVALVVVPRALSARAALAPRAGQIARYAVHGAARHAAVRADHAALGRVRGASVGQERGVPMGIARVAAGAGVIVENGQAPLSPLAYSITNHWYEVKNGANVIVYAGAERGDPSQGIVVIERASADYTSVAGPYIYRAPLRAGALRVVGAVGERLRLAAANGTLLSFDVPAGVFVTP